MKRNNKIYSIVILIIISFLTIGYSAYTNNLALDDLSALFRVETNVRITGVSSEIVGENASSQYEEYGARTIKSQVSLPTNDSIITYNIDITNFGGTYVVLSKITGVPSNLDYTVENYDLNTVICDDTNKCHLGITKTIKLSIKQKDDLEEIDLNTYNLNLEFEFNEFEYTLNYIRDEKDIELVIDDSYDSSVNDSITLTDGVYRIDKSSNYTGLYIDGTKLTNGKTYILSYKIKKISGTLKNIGGHSENAIEKSFTIDGVKSEYPYHQPKSNLNDDTKEHIIEFKFEYDGNASSNLTENKNIYIQVNRTGGTATPVVIDLWDIEIYEVYQENSYTYDEKVAISSGFKKEGYVLTEWNTEPDGSGPAYGVNANILNITDIHGAQINLYPQWAPKTYNGVPIYHMVEELAIPGNVPSQYVTSSTGIDFMNISGDTNGKGVYIFDGTENDEYPTYYYRGDIDNNNVLFGGHCWKILRTTETGGTKLVYNGKPVNGVCDNQGINTFTHTGKNFASTSIGLSSAGYSYTDKTNLLMATKASSEIKAGTIFASDAEYVEITNETTGETSWKYRLIGDKVTTTGTTTATYNAEREALIKEHHYTCFSTTDDICDSVKFVYMVRDNNNYYAPLTNGMTLEQLLNIEFNGNSTNEIKSSIQNTVNTWYVENLLNLESHIEDTVYCNDRTLYQPWSQTSSVANNTDDKTHFGAKARVAYTGGVTVNCPKLADSFTVSEENGNGVLEHPIGLITLDEIVLAGYAWGYNALDNYLYTGVSNIIWWTMSPGFISAGGVYPGVIYSTLDTVAINYKGSKIDDTNYTGGGVRPVISLKYGVTIKEGFGTKETPFIIDEQTYVPVSQIYDPTNEVAEKMHIGDFVNYDAGTWLKSEIDTIKTGLIYEPVNPNNSLELPKKAYQFGGFKTGSSRNDTSVIAQFESLGEVKYINNAQTNKPISGWRIYDIDEETNEVTLISAGNPEAFFQTGSSDGGYSTPYIFNGTVHTSWGDANASNYERRSWNHYINTKQSAKSAYILSKSDLEAWYLKHIGSSGDLWTQSNFQKIYQYPRLHNIIDNYSFWWLASTRAAAGPHFVQGDSDRRLRGGNEVTLGIRINIVLSDEAKFSSERVGIIELESEHLNDYGGNQTYNVWNLKSKP